MVLIHCISQQAEGIALLSVEDLVKYCVLSLLMLPLAMTNAVEPVSYFYSDTPPYEYTDQSGQPAGLGIDAVRRVFHAAGLSPSFQFYSVPRGLLALQQNVDFTAIVAPTPAQRQKYKVAQQPIYHVQLGVIRLRSSPPMHSLLQLQTEPYLALQESIFPFLARRPELNMLAKQRYDVAQQADAIRLLISERYRYFLCYHHQSLTLDNPLLVFDPIETLPVYLMLWRDAARAERLLFQIDHYLAASSL